MFANYLVCYTGDHFFWPRCDKTCKISATVEDCRPLCNLQRGRKIRSFHPMCLSWDWRGACRSSCPVTVPKVRGVGKKQGALYEASYRRHFWFSLIIFVLQTCLPMDVATSPSQPCGTLTHNTRCGWWLDIQHRSSIKRSKAQRASSRYFWERFAEACPHFFFVCPSKK